MVKEQISGMEGGPRDLPQKAAQKNKQIKPINDKWEPLKTLAPN